MSKILKAATFTIDNDNKISIQIMDPSLYTKSDESEGRDESEEDIPENIGESIIENAKRDADRIIRHAKQESEAILNKARIEAEQNAAQVMEESRISGHQEGYTKGLSEAQQIMDEANNVLDEAIKRRSEIIDSIEPDMIDLIEKIVNKLLSVEVGVNPRIILNLIKQGMADATLTGDVTIHVSADDYDTVVQNRDEIVAGLEISSKIEVYRDLSLTKSDCIIETEYGNIDCSLDQQFHMLKRDLRFILAR